jgi:hypothetical protein
MRTLTIVLLLAACKYQTGSTGNSIELPDAGHTHDGPCHTGFDGGHDPLPDGGWVPDDAGGYYPDGGYYRPDGGYYGGPDGGIYGTDAGSNGGTDGGSYYPDAALVH